MNYLGFFLGTRAHAGSAALRRRWHAVRKIGTFDLFFWGARFTAGEKQQITMRPESSRPAATSADNSLTAIEETLRLSAVKFATAFRASPSMMTISELDTGTFTDVSDSIEATLGYSSDDLIGRSALDVGFWANPAQREKVLQELWDAGRAATRDVMLLGKDGREHHCLLSAEIIELDARRYVLSTMQDITDYKAAITALHEREVSYQTLFNAVNDAIFVYRLDADGLPGQFIEVNDIACQWLGMTREKLLTLSPLDIVGPGGLTAATQSDDRLLERKSILFETTILTQAGEEIPVESNAHLFQLGDQHAVMSVVRDIRERKRHEKVLRATEAKYRQIFENAVEGIYQSTPEGKLINANPALAELLGFDSVADLITHGGTVQRFYVNRQQRAELLRRIEERGSYADAEYEIIRYDGSRIWVSDNARAVRGKAGRVQYYEGTLQDITPRKLAEEALSQSEEKYRTLVDTSQDGVFIAQHNRLVYVNQALARMAGYSVAEMTQSELIPLIAPEDQGPVLQYYEMHKASNSGPKRFELHLLHKNGHTRIAVAAHVGSIVYRGEHAITGTVRDVTEQKKAEQQLVYTAYHDVLTGLPNRAFFLERLKQAMERARRRSAPSFAVLFLDLDRFKLINDSLGHTYGDKLLIAIAKRLRECMRPADLLARHGGDEFTVLVEDIESASGAVAVAERIHNALLRPFNVDNHEVFTNASTGIVASAPHYSDPDEMLRDADTAMYRAKAAGKAAYVMFDDAMHELAKAHLTLETDLRHALERNEFRLFYQPIVDIATRRITGFEALLRWQHPHRGLLAPAEFLTITEETGLIIPVGTWVLETACAQLQAWRRQFPAFRELAVNINIANRQFSHWDLPDWINRTLRETGLPASCLRLEITENVFMANKQVAAAMLAQLKQLGISLQMDDFGTGYSSLSGLRTYPLDTLKIDRSFIQDIADNAEDYAIVRTIAQLGQQLDMEIVAEGVEHERQLELLRNIGCTLAQGYYFAYPMDATTVEKFLAQSATETLVTALPGQSQRSST